MCAHILDMKKDSLDVHTRSCRWLFGPKKYPGLLRNGLQVLWEGGKGFLHDAFMIAPKQFTV